MLSKLHLGPGVKVLDQPLKSLSEFETWKYAVLYNLKLNDTFKEYLTPDYVFGAKTAENPSRDFTDTSETTSAVNEAGETVHTVVIKKTKESKCDEVDFMLQQIAGFCPKIPHNDIICDCGSLEDVWQVIRLHSNIETSGALLNHCWNITRLPDETPQALYSRIKQSYDENLIRKNTLIYKNNPLTTDEIMSPTLHCTIILQWLNVLHPRLRDLVTQRFGIELRSRSYAALWPEISKSVDSLLKELSDSEVGSSCRFNDRFSDMSIRSPSFRARGSFSRPPRYPRRSTQSFRKSCDYCRIQGRSAYQTHNIDDCKFLQKEKPTSSSYHPYSKAVEVEEPYDEYQEYQEHLNEFYDSYPDSAYRVEADHILNRVAINASPVFTVFHHNIPYELTLDTGGTCSVIPSKVAKEMQCQVRPTYQRARMADGKSALNVCGETDVEFRRAGKVYKLAALVCDVSDSTILAGMPFMRHNDIAVRPATSEIIIDGEETVKYNSTGSGVPQARRIESYMIKSPNRVVLLPGQTFTQKLPGSLSTEESVAIEPCYDSSPNQQKANTWRSHGRIKLSEWPPPAVQPVTDGSISLKNTTEDPIIIKKNEGICMVQAPVSMEDVPEEVISRVQIPTPPVTKKTSDYSSNVILNPDKIMNSDIEKAFKDLLHTYDDVFSPVTSGYNGKSGACFVEVNMGPQPPEQHKGHVPFYGRSNMQELQEKFDQLEMKGVFVRPQDIGVSVEVVNPSFLVKKQPPSVDKRLVTDFSQISSYCRPSPSLMSTVEPCLRKISRWRRILKSDFSEAYFQIWLKKSSMKYCGTVSPNKGVVVYTRGCMGLPGSECALEELTTLLFKDMIDQGKVVKMADDLFFGGANDEELLQNFEEGLSILHKNNIKLNAKKTIIAPKSVTVMGWIWEDGTLRGSTHRLSALAEVPPPDTVKAMRSFLGAYRFLSRVLKGHASLLKPLEDMITGQSAGNVKLQWSDESLAAFKSAQLALKDAKTIVQPVPDDVLWVVTDAAIQPAAIGATLYVLREGKPHVAGYYNAKLPVYQRRWLPCEVEGVAIGAALKHFGPYILDSNHKPCVLTDSKACVQAISRLKRGEYSTSARLCTFLSQVSRFQAEVKLISGQSNQFSDFLSRNPLSCSEAHCQVCKFIKDTMESVVASISVKDVLDGNIQLPFTNKHAWLEIQQTCPDLRRLRNYLENGTKPGRNSGTNLTTVKRYKSSGVVISSQGLLVKRELEPLAPAVEKIVVPKHVIQGLLTAIHLKLEHPTTHQLRKVINRYFYAINLESILPKVYDTCHQCQSIKDIPTALISQSTEDPPNSVGERFAADIIKRHKQMFLIMRECTTSYTLAQFLHSETAEEVSATIMQLSNLMRPSSLLPIYIRVDPSTSHQSLFKSKDSILKAQNIHLVLGRTLNVNKNPVIDKACRELIREILLLHPAGGPLTSSQLSQAIANLNSRLRSSGLSSHEMFTHRDQVNGKQLHFDDNILLSDQHKRRLANHKYSERSKAGNKPAHNPAEVSIGSIVYLYSDGSKNQARPRYIIIDITDGWCTLRRLTDRLVGFKSYQAKLTEVYKTKDELGTALPLLTEDEDNNHLEDIILSQSPIPQAQSKDDTLNPPTVPDTLPVVPEINDDEEEYPCTVCQQEVLDEDQALLCDQCSSWCHRECCHMSEEEYHECIEDSGFTWLCPHHIDAGSSDKEEEIQGVQENIEVLPREKRLRKAPDRYGTT